MGAAARVRSGQRLGDSNLGWCGCDSRGTRGWNWASNWKGRDEVTIMTVDEMVSLLGGPRGMMGRTAPNDESEKSHHVSDVKGESLPLSLNRGGPLPSLWFEDIRVVLLSCTLSLREIVSRPESSWIVIFNQVFPNNYPYDYVCPVVIYSKCMYCHYEIVTQISAFHIIYQIYIDKHKIYMHVNSNQSKDLSSEFE